MPLAKGEANRGGLGIDIAPIIRVIRVIRALQPNVPPRKGANACPFDPLDAVREITAA